MPIWLKGITYGAAFASGYKLFGWQWWFLVCAVAAYAGAVLDVSSKANVQDWTELNTQEFKQADRGVPGALIGILLVSSVFFGIGWLLG